MTNIFFNTVGVSIVCIIFILFILILYVVKNNKLKFVSKLYVFLVILTLISNIFYILWGYFQFIGHDSVNLISRIMCYFVSLWDIFFIIYVFFVFKSQDSVNNFLKKYKVHLIVFLCFIFILNFIICSFLSVNTELSVRLYILTGHLFSYLDYLAIVSIGLGLLVLLFYRKMLNKLTKLIGIYIFLISTVSIIIQTLFDSFANDMCFRMTALVLFLFFSVENQDAVLLNEYKVSMQKAEESNKLKGIFINNLSYQFKRPLNSILGFSGLLLNEGDLSLDKVHSDADTIYESSSKLLNLLNSILDLSKFESGEMVIKSSNYKINDLINDVINSFEFDKFNLEVNNDCLNELCGDEEKLNKILCIFLDNMICNNSGNFINLKISSNVIDSLNSELVFSISSVGSNFTIDEFNRDLNELIKLSYENGTNVDFDSLNVIVGKSLIDIMGGEIKYFNDDSLTLYEIKLKQKVVNQNKISQITNIMSYNLDLTGKKVLIVDDKNVTSVVLNRMLKKYNLCIDISINPNDVSDLNKMNNYDIIFVDYDLDDMNAEDVVKKLNLSGNRVAPCVGIVSMKSRYGNDSLFNYFLDAPINDKKLNSLLNEIINGGDNNVI